MPDLIQDTAPAQVCVVDDDTATLASIAATLQAEFDVRLARCGQEALQLVQLDPPDLVLLDVHLPDISGVTVCQRLKQDPHTEAVPVIFLTAESDESVEVAGLNAGAADFILKPLRGPAVLARIRHVVRMKRLAERLRREAETDPLTRLANRRRFMATIDAELLRALRQGMPLSVLMLDVDHFKAYNDHYGYLSAAGPLPASISTT